jgi:hypothetical protein
MCGPLPVFLLGHAFYDLSPGVIASGKTSGTSMLPTFAGAFAVLYLMLNFALITDLGRSSLREAAIAFETMPLMWLRLAPYPVLAMVFWSSYFASFAATATGITIHQGPIFGNTLLRWSDAQSIDVVCSRFDAQSHPAQHFWFGSHSSRNVEPFLIANFNGWKLNLWFGEGQQMFAHLPEISKALANVHALLYYPETRGMLWAPRQYVIDPTTATGCPRSIEKFLIDHDYVVSTK